MKLELVEDSLDESIKTMQAMLYEIRVRQP